MITLYQVVLQRDPTRTELRRARDFLAQQSASAKAPPLAKLAQVLLLSNEFMFVD